ncbi:hypothetical protein M501DRAFT_1054837 [Patellaria atrata CBS 101060]|uniref:Uncharacterized protein n=1 Tax=Patellaria atrata CBS 101060 TaxID=1346257 RepID=A0A9P4SGW8_9PEZI|nr:hypothetical protein M501DRAFT_1054837 [Patellaria atrata CBS 101060]
MEGIRDFQNDDDHRPMLDLQIRDEDRDAYSDTLSSELADDHTEDINISSLGAIITVSSLALSKLSQQILVIENRAVILSGNSSAIAPRSEFYGVNHTETEPAGERVADVTMMATLQNYFIGADQQSVPANCPSGNCKWPIIPSLGICGTCTNVTNRVVRNASGDQYDDGKEHPHNVSLSPVALLQVAKKLKGYLEYEVTPASPPKILEFLAIGVRKIENWLSHEPEFRPLRANICSLSFCVRATEVIDGKELLAIKDIWYNISSKTYFAQAPQEFDVEEEIAFGYAKENMEALVRALDPILNGIVVSVNDSLEIDKDFVEQIWSINITDKMDSWIKGLANSMTNAIIKEASPPNRTRYHGTVITEESFNRVRWL